MGRLEPSRVRLDPGRSESLELLTAIANHRRLIEVGFLSHGQRLRDEAQIATGTAA
jgi:hypothetical protein